MVRSVETIRREIDSLNQATVALAAEFNRLYTSYLDSLGLALRHQVIMAAYHLCTQVYPEGFLALSVKQRESLQGNIRQLGHSGATWLQQLMEPTGAGQERLSLEVDAEPVASEPDREVGVDDYPLESSQLDAADQQPMEAPHQDPQLQDREADEQPDDELMAMAALQGGDEPASRASAEDTEPDAEDTEPDDEDEDEALPLPSLLKSMVMAALVEDISELLGDRLFVGDDITPTRLAKQHIYIEQQIREILQRVSKRANHLLQAAQVIPNLPEAVLDAASETEVGPSRGRSVPNVLNVLVAISADGDEPLDRAMERASRAMARQTEEEDDDDDDDDYESDEGDESDEENEPREGMMTHLAAINLRLSDIEFTDVQASLRRGKLRNALGQLRKLGKQYQKAQREMAISEAEHAWRAVWYNDSPR